MRMLEVCDSSQTVLILLMVLCLATDEGIQHKQVLVSSGFVLSWNIKTGKAKTLECLGIEEFDGNPCSVKTWNVGVEIARDLRKKWFVPSNTNRSVRAFSNISVFSGQSLTKLSHPYLPVAIIL